MRYYSWVQNERVCVCVCVSGEGGVALIGDPRVIVLLICCEKYCLEFF